MRHSLIAAIAARLIAGVCAGGVTAAALAQTPPAQGKSLAASAGLFAYPAKGQAAQQQTLDEAECYNWAKQQSGYDPMSPPAASAQPQSAQTQQKPQADGKRARAILRGAAAGAAIGEVANDDAGQGAAVGATVGLLAGGRQSRMAQAQQIQQAQAQQQASAEQAKAAQEELVASFRRGMTVCLEARGYAVK